MVISLHFILSRDPPKTQSLTLSPCPPERFTFARQLWQADVMRWNDMETTELLKGQDRKDSRDFPWL